MRPELAPIELLHPNGAPRGTAVVGEGVPDWLLPIDARIDGKADVVLVAADTGESEQCARVVVERLSEEGIVIAVGPRSARQSLAAALAHRGFTHHELLTAQRRRRGRSVELIVGGAPSSAALVRNKRVQGTVLRRGNSMRLGGWLPAPGPFLRVRTSWRGSGDTALVARLDSRGTPTLYAKVGLGASTADVGAREAAAVTALGPAAAAAGARVPHVRGQVQIAGRPAVFLSALEGRPVAQASRRKIDPSAGATSDWLRRFGRETHAQAPAQPVVETSVLRPSGLVVRGLDGGTAYVESLRQLAEALGDRSLTVTAAHGDLTLWNVLTGETPGILDWAGASETALPLVDLPYLLVDARYWRSLRRDRLQAFRECFPDGRMRIDEQLIGFDAPPPVLELAFHACWLGHAANERRQGIRGPFSEIVGALARKASP